MGADGTGPAGDDGGRRGLRARASIVHVARPTAGRRRRPRSPTTGRCCCVNRTSTCISLRGGQLAAANDSSRGVRKCARSVETKSDGGGAASRGSGKRRATRSAVPDDSEARPARWRARRSARRTARQRTARRRGSTRDRDVPHVAQDQNSGKEQCVPNDDAARVQEGSARPTGRAQLQPPQPGNTASSATTPDRRSRHRRQAGGVDIGLGAPRSRSPTTRPSQDRPRRLYAPLSGAKGAVSWYGKGETLLEATRRPGPRPRPVGMPPRRSRGGPARGPRPPLSRSRRGAIGAALEHCLPTCEDAGFAGRRFGRARADVQGSPRRRPASRRRAAAARRGAAARPAVRGRHAERGEAANLLRALRKASPGAAGRPLSRHRGQRGRVDRRCGRWRTKCRPAGPPRQARTTTHRQPPAARARLPRVHYRWSSVCRPDVLVQVVGG